MKQVQLNKLLEERKQRRLILLTFYYLRIIKVIYFDKAKDSFDKPIGIEITAILGITGIITALDADSTLRVSKPSDGALSIIIYLYTAHHSIFNDLGRFFFFSQILSFLTIFIAFLTILDAFSFFLKFYLF